MCNVTAIVLSAHMTDSSDILDAEAVSDEPADAAGPRVCTRGEARLRRKQPLQAPEDPETKIRLDQGTLPLSRCRPMWRFGALTLSAFSEVRVSERCERLMTTSRALMLAVLDIHAALAVSSALAATDELSLPPPKTLQTGQTPHSLLAPQRPRLGKLACLSPYERTLPAARTHPRHLRGTAIRFTA